MAKYDISARVVGSKYIGEFEADTKEEAIELAWKKAWVSLCHQCSSECEDAEIEDLYADEVND